MEGSGQPKPESGAQTGAISKKKKEDKKSKRDPKFPDNLFKSIASNTVPEKLEIMEERYKELYSEYRNAMSNNKLIEKRLEATYKEKDHVENDLNKARLARAKVEALARELQRQNKEIKEENYNRLKEEEEKRKAVAANFTEKLNALTALMDENRDKSLRLREENLSMTSKLSDLYNQFQERELSLANMNKQVELQKKLTETQLKKLEIEFETEREVWAKERTMLVSNLDRSEEANSLLQENIKALQSHIDSYQKQYCDFENTMQRSNKVFDTFKHEMEKLKKINTKLEKDKGKLEERSTSNAQTILRCTAAIEQRNREIQRLNTRYAALEKLTRQALADRGLFMQQLIDCGFIPASLTLNNPTQTEGATAECNNLPLASLCDMLEIPPEVQANILKADRDVARYKESFRELANSIDGTKDELTLPDPVEEDGVDEICCRLETSCSISAPADQEEGAVALEPAQDFDRIPPLPTDIVPDTPKQVPHKGKGKKKKSGNAANKRARDTRSQDDTENAHANENSQEKDVDSECPHPKSDTIGDSHSLKPYNLHVAERFPQQFDGMVDCSLLPECDISASTGPAAPGGTAAASDGAATASGGASAAPGSDEPKPTTQEA